MQRYNFIIVLPSIAAYYFLLTQTASRNAFPDFVSGFRYNVPLRCSFNYSNIFSFGGHSCPVDLYILYIILNCSSLYWVGEHPMFFLNTALK